MLIRKAYKFKLRFHDESEGLPLAYDSYEAAFEISFRNHKKEDAIVKVVEPIPGRLGHAEFFTPLYEVTSLLRRSLIFPCRRIRRLSLSIM